MEYNSLVILLYFLGYIVFAFLATTYLKWFDGIRRFVISILLGWVAIPLALLLIIVRGVLSFFKWLFRL